ncbi:hypothetical protein ACFQ4K_28390 [Tistrella bauzanensis]
MSQSAVTEAIKSIEHQLGCRCFSATRAVCR